MSKVTWAQAGLQDAHYPCVVLPSQVVLVRMHFCFSLHSWSRSCSWPEPWKTWGVGWGVELSLPALTCQFGALPDKRRFQNLWGEWIRGENNNKLIQPSNTVDGRRRRAPKSGILIVSQLLHLTAPDVPTGEYQLVFQNFNHFSHTVQFFSEYIVWYINSWHFGWAKLSCIL